MKAGNAAEVWPSLALMMMLPNSPTLTDVGVPDS